MCIPLLPLALAAAGTFASYMGEKQAANARESTFMAERKRQQDFTAGQQARFQDSLDKTAGTLTPEAIAAAAGQREAALSSAITPTSTVASYLPGSSSAPAVVGEAKAKAAEGSKAYAGNLAHALAALGGTNDQMRDLNTGIGRNSELIGQINSFKSGSMGVLDDEMRAAAQKGATLRAIGGLAQKLGSAWLTGGIGGAGGGAGAGLNVTQFEGAV